MALKEFWNGSVGPLLYDDEDTYEDGETLRGVRVDQILLDSAPAASGEALRQTATVTEDELEDAIAKKHTQNTDTALGAQSEDLDMNTHQVVALSVPDAAGEAIRQTTKITEAALETVIDSGGGGQDIIDYRIETGKSVTIEAYQYLDIKLVEEYIIEGTGTLTINDNGFLNVGV